MKDPFFENGRSSAVEKVYRLTVLATESSGPLDSFANRLPEQSGGRPAGGHQDLGICGKPPEHRRKHLPHVGEPSEKAFHGRHVRRTDH